MGRTPLGQIDEIDIQIAILEGLDWKPGEIAERLDRTTEAIRLRKIGPKKALIDTITAFTLEGVAKRLQAKFKAIDAKQRIVEKSYRSLEQLLDRGEQKNGETILTLDALTLGAIKEGLDRTEGKALDRKAILSRHEEVKRTEVDEDVLAEILVEVRSLNDLRRKALGPAEEAQLVGSEEQAN